jgi:hypothetical protein
MKNELIQKIGNVLAKRITNEKQVVYLLVEIRKLMERDGYKDEILKTFSNWVVHTSLDRKADGSTFILREFDHLIGEIFERKTELKQVEHISLSALRNALSRLCSHFGFVAMCLSSLIEWKKFARLYCMIVSECPIVFKASRVDLKYIRQVELIRLSRGIVVREWPVVDWRITLRDGTIWNWGFHVG